MRLLSDLDIAKKKVGLRLDLNVPIKEGVITDDTRILASLETLTYLIKAEAKIVILSHLGRPKEGTFDDQLSLRPVASHLSNELGISISLINSMKEFHDTNTQICMLENIRFFEGESKNSDSLAREIGSHIDVYVFDAFG
ncbi:MAG: phosphoglycerate kinase, partial [SAR86 cluster bacterium]